MRIAVIFGGRSDEHEVSRNSARNFLNSLNKEKYEVIQVGITREGVWYATEATPDEIASGDWEKRADNLRCFFACDPVSRGLAVLQENGGVDIKSIDCAVPMLHGDFGEDGTIQGVFEMSGVPYVGPGVKASANCMDKSVTKKLAESTGVTMARCFLLTRDEYRKDAEAAVKAAEAFHGGEYPVFVKPSSAGSSVGTSKAANTAEMRAAIDEALKYDDKVLIEEMIVGRELEVAVMGNREPVTSGAVGEILTAGEFYTYDAKYNNPDSKTRVADDLPEGVSEEIQSAAIALYKALDCRGLSRVDFFYSEAKGVVFNEINTLPGFTSISMYPQLWRTYGMSDEEIADHLIDLAIMEFEDRSR